MTFDLYSSKIYRAVDFSRYFSSKQLAFWRKSLIIPGLLAVVAYTLEVSAIEKYNLPINLYFDKTTFLGWAILLIPIGPSILFFELFFEYYLKWPNIKEGEQNLAGFLDFDSALIVSDMLAMSKRIREEKVSTGSLLKALVRSEVGRHILLRLGFDPDELKKRLSGDDFLSKAFGLGTVPVLSEDLEKVLIGAELGRVSHKDSRITPMDLILALYDVHEGFQQAVINRGMDKKDLNNLAKWYESHRNFYESRKRFWHLSNLRSKVPIGVNFIYANSPHVEMFAHDIGHTSSGRNPKLFLAGNKRIIDLIQGALSRAGESNVLLVGEPGVGKERIIEDFAQMIAEEKALPSLLFKRMLELNVPLITSSAKDMNGAQNILIEVFNEAVNAGNIILVIKDIHNFIGGLSGLGTSDISKIIIPYLESSNLQVIATTDPVNYHKYIESRPELLKVFDKIDIEQPDKEAVLARIEELIPPIESRFGLFFTYGAIKAIVDDADKYIQTVPFPEKAIDVLSEVVSYVQGHKKKVVLPEDVHEFMSHKTNIPIGAVKEGEKEKLLNLEKDMHADIVGQNEAVRLVSITMQRIRAGLKARGKPAGVFLFVGPTGVGKTQTAKILAKTYFGSPERMLRFDMSEFQDPTAVERFLGSIKENDPGQLPSLVRDHPFSLLLLDEFEKAHKNILNLFLQVFDEGHITDVFGRRVSFEQCIIIATSNAGADVIREMVNSGLDLAKQKQKLIDTFIGGHYFTPELLNRFDEIVIFHPLSQDQVSKISGLLMDKLVLRLKDEGFLFTPGPEIVEYVAKEGFDPQFGARPMQRVIRDKVENVIARKILEGTIKKGVPFTLNLQDIS